jgi:hypothetical protein
MSWPAWRTRWPSSLVTATPNFSRLGIPCIAVLRVTNATQFLLAATSLPQSLL